MKEKVAYIVGNGPSLRGFDFARNLHGRICFGMNLAYRYWHSIGWYPSFYSCLDEVVGMCHLEDIYNLIENRQKFGIKAFFLRSRVIEALDIKGLACVSGYEELLQKFPSSFRGYGPVTGSLTVAWALWLGYRNLVLLGIDGNYVKYIKNSRHVDDVILKLETTPEYNPNYFFDGYQRGGDLYHVPVKANPNISYEYQLMSWHMLTPQIAAANAVIVNANPDSAVNAFACASFQNALPLLRKLRRARKNKVYPLGEEFPRKRGAIFNPLNFAMDMLGPCKGLLFDIGSYHGRNCLVAVGRGWDAHAVEADAANRLILKERLKDFKQIQIEPDVISCLSGARYPWYSQKDARMNAMQDMTGSGIRCNEVVTSTIGDLIKNRNIETLDILVLDISGFEFMALRGLPFQKCPPRCIIAGWDDALSMQLGSDMHDLGSFLIAQGYIVFMSEWHPKPEGEWPVQWRRLTPYPARTTEPGAWGQFIAFREKPSLKKLNAALGRNIRSDNPVRASMPAFTPC